MTCGVAALSQKCLTEVNTLTANSTSAARLQCCQNFPVLVDSCEECNDRALILCFGLP